jgi:probable phosphoglycerate mutase
MNELYIMRHGETEWNSEKRYQGQMDSDLTEFGKQGTLLQKDKIQGIYFKTVYCSPLGRTRSTMNLLKPCSTEIIYDERLMEICLGALQGKTHQELSEQEKIAQHTFWSDPENFDIDGGETMVDLEKRVQSFLTDLNKKEGPILIITHTVIIKMMLKILESRPLAKLWDAPYLHPGTILVLHKDKKPYIQEVIHTHNDMQKPVSYIA